jgi:hypothetical protein
MFFTKLVNNTDISLQQGLMYIKLYVVVQAYNINLLCLNEILYFMPYTVSSFDEPLLKNHIFYFSFA